MPVASSRLRWWFVVSPLLGLAVARCHRPVPTADDFRAPDTVDATAETSTAADVPDAPDVPDAMELEVQAEDLPPADPCQTAGCDLNATCSVTEGKAKCACRLGYVGSGQACAPQATCKATATFGHEWSTGDRNATVGQSGNVLVNDAQPKQLIDGKIYPFDVDVHADATWYQFDFARPVGMEVLRWHYRPSWSTDSFQKGYLGAYRVQASENGKEFIDISDLYDLGQGEADTAMKVQDMAILPAYRQIKYPHFRLFRVKAPESPPNEVEAEFSLCE